MATFDSKAWCTTCDKGKRTVICEGCFRLFCFDHLIDHRQELNQQLDHIEMDRDLFEQALNENTTDPQKHVLLQQIGQWEQDSIKKIQQRASECRQSVIELTNKNIHLIEAKLTKLTDQIRKIRQENDFNEIDLNEFNERLKQLQQQIHQPSDVSIQQSSTLFVNEISVVVATPPSINDGSQPPSSNTSTLGENLKAITSSVSDLTGPTRTPISSSIIPSPSTPLINEDIRLCTINRAHATDTLGIELNYHRREQLHSLSIISGRDDGVSNAELAGIKSDDRLIEINGRNIQNLDHDQVTQRIRYVKYPEPLQMLVVNFSTYDYYKQQQKLIHRGLPNVIIMPESQPTVQWKNLK